MRPSFHTRRGVLAATLAFALAAVLPLSATAGEFGYRSDESNAWPRNVVREVQRQLHSRGFDPGPIDGLYGDRTAKGIADFQTANGLTPDGRISDSLLDALSVN